jgi:hypothetical protein
LPDPRRSPGRTCRIFLSLPRTASPDPLAGPVELSDLHLGPAVRPECFSLPRVLLWQSTPSRLKYSPDLHLVTSADLTRDPYRQTRTSSSASDLQFSTFHRAGLRFRTPGVPDLCSVCFPTFPQSGNAFLFPPSDPQPYVFRPSAFPRARVSASDILLSQQRMSATWRACSHDRLQVFLHAWRRRPPRGASIPSV